jgi:Lipocalin-like domain
MRYRIVLPILALLSCRPAAADNDLADKLVGSWQIVSQKVQVVGEPTERDIMGAHPVGRIIFSADRHFCAFLSRSDRSPPQSDTDAAALLRSMGAFTGKFRIEGDKIIYTVDGAWNEVYKQKEQVRIIHLDGDRLTSATPEQASAFFPGKHVTGVAVFVREHSP